MITSSLHEDLAVALLDQLRIIAQQLREGMDVAPAQRLQLEGVAVALLAEGIDIDVLERECIAAGENVIIVTRENNALRFDCWQRRAPVYPSTGD